MNTERDDREQIEAIKKMMAEREEKRRASIKGELRGFRRFASFMYDRFPEVKHFTEISRDMIEDYLVYIKTDTGLTSVSYTTELSVLDNLLDEIGRELEIENICNLFLSSDWESDDYTLIDSDPSFVSKFTLLAGAGMTVPFIFQTMEKEEKNPYLAMELKLFCRDMKNEMLEPALDKFGKRCGSAHYLKFCALLIQNVKKGTKDFLPMLREEAASAFLLQKQQVKKAGEEAGTKLLFPMVLLLLLVMLLIMIPAFLSFSVS